MPASDVLPQILRRFIRERVWPWSVFTADLSAGIADFVWIAFDEGREKNLLMRMDEVRGSLWIGAPESVSGGMLLGKSNSETG